MPRCCRAGAARRRFSVHCWRGTCAPASPSCTWRLAWIRVPMLAARSIHIDARDTAKTLHDMLAMLGAHLIMETLDALRRGRSQRGCAARRRRHLRGKNRQGEALIRWARDSPKRFGARFAPSILGRWRRRASRGNNCEFGKRSRSIQCDPMPRAARGSRRDRCLPRRREGIDVVCGRGYCGFSRLQLAGRNPLPAEEFLQGQRLEGTRFGNT